MERLVSEKLDEEFIMARRRTQKAAIEGAAEEELEKLRGAEQYVLNKIMDHQVAHPNCKPL